MSEERRINELDIAKSIGIVLIVLGHLEPGTYLMRFVYSFHLFLFFACSGFLGQRYEDRTTAMVILNNLKRLLLPYLIWNIITQAVSILLQEIDLVQAAKNILFLNANVGWNAALWFLVSLFWADTLCCFIVKCHRWIQYSCAGAFLLLWFLLARYEVALPLGLYTVPVASLFWLLGYYIRKTSLIERINKTSNMAKITWGGVLLLVNICFGTVFNSVISIYHIKYENILFTIIAGVVGVVAVFLFCGFVFRSKKLNKMLFVYGKNTLTILCTHYFVLRLIGEISVRIIGINLWRATSTPKSILFAVGVLCIYYPIILALSKIKENHPWVKYII